MPKAVAGGTAHVLTSDDTVIRVAAGLRITLAVSVAATGSFLPHLHGRTSAFFLLAELVWLPLATAVFFASARPRNVLARLGGPAGDLLALFALQVLVPEAAVASLLGYLVVVAYAVYTAGRRVAAQLAAVAIALAAGGGFLVPSSDRLTSAILISFSAATLVLLLVLERTATVHAETEARALSWQSRADTILSHVADAVVVTDRQGRVLQVNGAAERLIGPQAETAIGRSCTQVLDLHRGERQLDCSAGCAILILLEGAEASLGCELWRARTDGQRQPLLANATAVSGGHGDEIVHSLRDVTRIKQAEEAKTLFLATASHELKTPLTVIQGFADTLVRFPDLDSATKAAALKAIRSRSVELARIVERLLVSSRIEAGQVNLVVSECDVAPVITERVSAMAAATGRTVTYHGSRSVQAMANIDALVTVVDHLLDNALKYSPGAGPVTVDLTVHDDDVRLAVTDTGVGMDREQSRHCFDKFWQAESTDVRRFGGTGIGLYIVQSLVEAMGGSVAVASQPGRGTTFTVTLPRSGAAPELPEVGESTSIREFMRQLGVTTRGRL